MSDFTVYKPRNGQILKNGRVMSASDLAVELAQLQATNEKISTKLEEADTELSNYEGVFDKISALENDLQKHNQACRNTRERLLKLKATNERLTAENEKLNRGFSSVVAGLFSEEELASRDLEQRAKGIEDLIETCAEMINTPSSQWKPYISLEDAESTANQLRQQAKENG